MLIPHLHFDGNCMEAIDLYEKAFNTKVDIESIDSMPDGKKEFRLRNSRAERGQHS